MRKFDQFEKNLNVLLRADREDLDNEFVISGIIFKYYIQFELGWKVLKELLKYDGRGVGMSGSPREIIKAAYTYYDFMTEAVWLDMLRDRNDLTHIYDGGRARGLVEKILVVYIPEFERMRQCMREV